MLINTMRLQVKSTPVRKRINHVFARTAHWRARSIELIGPAAKARSQLRALIPAVGADDAARCPAPAAPLPLRVRRLPWADLLRRVFAEDILAYPCGGRRSVTAFVTIQRLAHSLLAALGQPAQPAAFAHGRQ